MNKATAIMLLLFTAIAGASVGSNKHQSSLGNVMYTNNPMTYKAGAITSAAYIEEGKAISVRIQPIGTYGLFTEDILFCDFPVDLFLNKTNPLVLTYRTVSHRMVQGVGCHELMSVHSLKTEKIE